MGITAAMPSGTSVSILQKEMPERVFDVGISEGHAVTFAGGLAKEGLLPFCAIYSSFLQRGYDQIINDIALQRLPVTFCIDRAGIVGEDGATHHGALDLAYMRAVPNMIVSAPADEQTLQRLMATAAEGTHGPMAIRYPRGAGRNADWKCELTPVEIGRGRRLADGFDVAVLTIGTTAYNVADAIAQCPDISVAHYDMIFLQPIDEDILREVAEKQCPVITVEDGTVKGGLGDAVEQWMIAHGFTPKIVRMGIPDRFIPQGTVAQLHKFCGFDADSILNTIKSVVKK